MFSFYTKLVPFVSVKILCAGDISGSHSTMYEDGCVLSHNPKSMDKMCNLYTYMCVHEMCLLRYNLQCTGTKSESVHYIHVSAVSFLPGGSHWGTHNAQWGWKRQSSHHTGSLTPAAH